MAASELMRRQVGCVVPIWYPPDMPEDEMRGFLAATLADVELFIAPERLALVVDGCPRAVGPTHQAAEGFAERAGGEPQVITIAAQLLFARGIHLNRVVALHTLPALEPISASLPALQAAFTAHPEWPPLSTVTVPTDDVLAPYELDAFADVLYRTLQENVSADCTVQ